MEVCQDKILSQISNYMITKPFSFNATCNTVEDNKSLRSSKHGISDHAEHHDHSIPTSLARIPRKNE